MLPWPASMSPTSASTRLRMFWNVCSRLALCGHQLGNVLRLRGAQLAARLAPDSGSGRVVMLMNLSPSRLEALIAATESSGISFRYSPLISRMNSTARLGSFDPESSDVLDVADRECR